MSRSVLWPGEFELQLFSFPPENCWEQRAFLCIAVCMCILCRRTLSFRANEIKKVKRRGAWTSGFSSQEWEITEGVLDNVSNSGLHGRLLFFPHAALLDERRALGFSGGWAALQPDLAQLCSLLFGCTVDKVLQEPGTEGVTLYIQHCAGAIAEKDDRVRINN